MVRFAVECALDTCASVVDVVAVEDAEKVLPSGVVATRVVVVIVEAEDMEELAAVDVLVVAEVVVEEEVEELLVCPCDVEVDDRDDIAVG